MIDVQALGIPGLRSPLASFRSEAYPADAVPIFQQTFVLVDVNVVFDLKLVISIGAILFVPSLSLPIGNLKPGEKPLTWYWLNVLWLYFRQLQILDGTQQCQNAFLEKAKPVIAVTTQQTADLVGLAIVVNVPCCFRFLSANGAYTALLGFHSVIISNCYTVAPD